MAERLHIALVASEAVPFVKTGGLADVVGALPKALARLGHRVTLFVPRYATLPFPPGELVGSVHVPVDSVTRSAGFYLACPAAPAAPRGRPIRPCAWPTSSNRPSMASAAR